ncbi:MAG TPA: PRC-barrel domain containing protein [Arthrobacter sp.]|jgi:sporulation protein YlmC with PRC-barrel domain
MILTDILGRDVQNNDGKKLGRVADARFVVDSTPGQLMANARLHGLIVSPHSAASFLGYERYGINQPWPLAQILRWRHRGSFLVLWEDIAVIGHDAVRLRSDFTAYSPALDSHGQ